MVPAAAGTLQPKRPHHKYRSYSARDRKRCAKQSTAANNAEQISAIRIEGDDAL